jgi:predicted dehydrogenase
MSIRIAVIGCGYWGPNFVRNFFKFRECRVVAVCDSSAGRLEQIQLLYPSVETSTDANEILRRSDIDGVAIVTPVSTHYALARQALLNGKHVLVTKPMSQRAAEAEDLVRLAEKHKRVLMVDHTFIYSGPVRSIRGLMERDHIGDLYYYDSTRVNLGLFQHDVNVLWDLGPHDLSVMLYLLGRKPKAISAIGAKPLSINGHASVAYMISHFEHDLTAHFHLSWLSPVKIRRTLLAGTKKMVVYDHLDPDNQVKVYDRGVELKAGEDPHAMLVQYRMGDMLAPKVDQTEALEIECRHFLECIRTGARPITDGEAGLDVVQLLEAAHLSIAKGGQVVTLWPSCAVAV